MDSREKRLMENQLMVMGLKSIDDPELIEQIAVLVNSWGPVYPGGVHEFLGGLLMECPKEQRRNAFEGLRPHLKFEPYPLDKYEAIAKEHASKIESRQNPITVGEEVFREVDQHEAQKVVVTMTCSKCRKQQSFIGDTPAEVATHVRKMGWVRDLVKQKEICPKCPAVRESVH